MFILQLSWDLFSLARPTFAIEKSSQPQKKTQLLPEETFTRMEKHWSKVEFHNFCKTTKKQYNTSILSIIEASVTAACKF